MENADTPSRRTTLMHDETAVQREFPQFRVWREITGDGVRYVARALSLGTSPHTVVTSDLAELRAALGGGGGGSGCPDEGPA